MRLLLRVVAVLHPYAREVSATKDLPQLPDVCCVHASLRFFNEIMVFKKKFLVNLFKCSLATF
jgi:hypothetical protein